MDPDRVKMDGKVILEAIRFILAKCEPVARNVDMFYYNYC